MELLRLHLGLSHAMWFAFLAIVWSIVNAEETEHGPTTGSNSILRADLSNLMEAKTAPVEGCPRRFPPVANADVTAMSFKLRPMPGEDPDRVKPGDGVVYRCRRNRDVQVLVLCTPDGSWLTTGVCPNSPSNVNNSSSASQLVLPVPRSSPRGEFYSAGISSVVPVLPPQSLKGFAQQNGNCEGGFMTDGHGKALSCPWCTLNACIDYCLKFQNCIAVSYSNERLIESTQHLRARSANRRVGNVTNTVPMSASETIVDEAPNKKSLTKPNNKKSLKGWVYFGGSKEESCEDETESWHKMLERRRHGSHHSHSHERPPNPPFCFLKTKYTCSYKFKPPGEATYTMFTRDPRVIIPSYTEPTIAPPPPPPPARPPMASFPLGGSAPSYRLLPDGNCGGGFLLDNKGEPEGCDVCSLATCQQLCNDRGSACLSVAYRKEGQRGPLLEEEMPKAANMVLGYGSNEDRSVWWPKPSFVELPPPRRHSPQHRGVVIEIDDSRVPSWEMVPPRRRHHHHSHERHSNSHERRSRSHERHSHSHERHRPPPPPPRACYLKTRSRCDDPIPCEVSNYDFYYKWPKP